MKKWTSDNWISLTAIIASIGTLFTVVYQTQLYREQQYASVLPYLEIWNSSQRDSYQLILVNNGIGPAFIDKVSIIYEDSVYQMDPANFLQKVIFPIDSIRNIGYSNISKGRLVPAGNRIDMLQVKGDSINVGKLWSWFSGNDPNREKIPNIEIEYSSVYGQSWKAQKYGLDQPVELN